MRPCIQPVSATLTFRWGVKPFEFNGFDPLWAKDRSASSGTTVVEAHDIGTEQTVTGFNDDDWIRFDEVWLGGAASPADSVTIRMSAVNTGTIRIMADSSTGPELARLVLNSDNFTDGINDYATFTIPIDPVDALDGVHDIYVRNDTNSTASVGVGRVSLVQFGRPNIGALPTVGTVTYDGGNWEYLDNRLNHPSGVSAMRMPRIEEIHNQLGGVISFDYSIANPCAPNVEVPLTADVSHLARHTGRAHPIRRGLFSKRPLATSLSTQWTPS